jgi:hypothetical protein
MTPPPSRIRQAMFKGGVILLLLVTGYGLAFRHAGHQVDAFCARVGTETPFAALPGIAKELGVKLIGPTLMDRNGAPGVSAVVVNPMTLGDYGCRVDASSMSGKVTAKALGYR